MVEFIPFPIEARSTVSYCNNCGEEYAEEQRFCSNCGNALDDRESRRRDRGGAGERDASEDEWGKETGGTDRGGEAGGWREEPDDGWGDGQAGGGQGQQSRGERSPRTQQRRQQPQHPPSQWPEIPRLNAIDTIVQSARWLVAVPALLGVFVLASVINSISGAVTPGLSLLFSLGGLLATIFAYGIAYVYAAAQITGGETTLGDAVNQVAGRFLPLILANIVYSILIGIGAIFFLIPGIYIGGRLAPALPAIVLDEYSTVDGLSVGWDIGDGNVLKLAGIFLVSLIPTVLTQVAAVATAGLGVFTNAAFLLGFGVVGSLFNAVSQLSFARVYVENY